MKNYLIYALQDPESGRVRYIGLSTVGEKRPKSHRSAGARRRRTRCAAWLRSLYKRGLKPEWCVIERCASLEAASDAERFWIAHYRAVGGYDIVNLTDGGFEGKVVPERIAQVAKERRERPTCRNGHLFTPENTGRGHKPGTRYCLTCRRQWRAEHREEQIAYLRAYHRRRKQEATAHA